MLTLLTTTGTRQECFDLLQQQMLDQDYQGPVKWVIVDDGEQQQTIEFSRAGWNIICYRPEPFWEPGKNTQIRNLLCGLEFIDASERVVVVEDDDYYGPGHLTEAAQQLEQAELVGELHPRYFNVQTGLGHRFTVSGHTSLAASSFRGAALSYFRECVKKGPRYVDIQMWRTFRGAKHLYPASNVIGIKGMPGRGGIGIGHKESFGEPVDPERWLGDAYRFYKRFILKRGTVMKVKALRGHGYGGKNHRKGDVYEITNKDHAKVLQAVKAIEPFEEPAKKRPGRPKKVTEPAPEEKKELIADKQPGYKTKVLKAEE